MIDNKAYIWFYLNKTDASKIPVKKIKIDPIIEAYV